MTEFLTREDLFYLVERLGVGPIRDFGLLEAAMMRPRTNLYGEDVYPTLHRKAAALLESLVRNHSLADGNKRLGWLATVVFYDLNGYEFRLSDDEAYELVIAVAAGELPVDLLAEKLTEATRPR
ncbi:type II toxin-antitoxin system death-on-curing family toxin [Schaalia sp. Marseille-Q2122]|uniref:type II toxin-antitoxin system death-on-curing family toxin n=1 Tax=Schaalia sp. Marseille-Q2122 TaxID=2736604 RepID=UPI00158BE29C|nr:type II toxin-antitoxin system death-on-curing family toxin [Schaalia sp. Marseille-Q2122]